MAKYGDCECVLARKQLTPKINKGEFGTVVSDYLAEKGLYLVEFDIDSDDLDEKIISVKEEDLLPYEE